MPFKPQNMSNNAAVTDNDINGDGGGEIGRAQWLQALACKVEPSVHMNPILLKPQSQTGSQIILQGKFYGSALAREYFSLKAKFLPIVLESLKAVSEHADIVLVEGAGSPAEINLRHGDVANMGFAHAANVPVILIGDIDRGGVIASIVGSHTILPVDDRQLIKGYVINKFRGDVSLFDAGLKAITEFTDWPSFGVLPFLDAVAKLPAEDSVALDGITHSSNGDGLKICVPVLGKIANFDDLDPLCQDPNVCVTFIAKGERIPVDAALVILPGSKSTISDMQAFRDNGWEADLHKQLANGGEVLGICGGYQMLGRKIYDPSGVEGNLSEIDGLGLLDIETTIAPEGKITQNSRPKLAGTDIELDGYEIHLGRTSGPDCDSPMILTDSGGDGAVSQDGKVRGCYLHGLFKADAARHWLLSRFGVKASDTSYGQQVDKALDALANHMETHLDVDGLLKSARPIRF